MNTKPHEKHKSNNIYITFLTHAHQNQNAKNIIYKARTLKYIANKINHANLTFGL